MKKGKIKKETRKKKEEVCEIIELEKDGKTETITSCGTEEDKPASENEIKNENRTLRNILIVLGVILFVFLVIYISIKSTNSFVYRGVSFEVYRGTVIQGKTIYGSSIPVMYQGKETKYNFFLRNDPRNLENVLFEGEISYLSEGGSLVKQGVINMSGNFKCDGEILGVANLVKMYNLFGINLIKDPNATCDSSGRYMFIQIQQGNKTKVTQTGPVCYTLEVEKCDDILKASEKLMVETFVRYEEVA